MASTSQNYELWETHDFLGVYRDMKPDPLYWTQWFENEMLSDSDWIDFEKMPLGNRKLAPFVMPLARGKALWDDSATVTRFKPAYSKAEDRIDPLMPLTRRVGIDTPFSGPQTMTAMERLDMIRAAMVRTHVDSFNRTFNYMAAMALRDGAITITGENYPSQVVDFGRAANQTITLSGGDRWGQSGVSILDFIQLVIDRMTTASFGGMPTRITMGSSAWNVMRKDDEILGHMDNTKNGNSVTVTRGVYAGADPVYKVGEVMVGGGSGATIELWVDNSTYLDPVTGTATRYIGVAQALFTAAPSAVMGYQCFGRIIDRAAEYMPMRLFPKNWMESGDLAVEYISHKSAPLFVPVNPNATCLANVV